MKKSFSKPELTNMLRYLSYMQYLSPYKIRYASVRSKHQLLSDVKQFFKLEFTKDYVLFRLTRYLLRRVPDIRFCLKSRLWLFDQIPVDTTIPLAQKCVTIRYNVKMAF